MASGFGKPGTEHRRLTATVRRRREPRHSSAANRGRAGFSSRPSPVLARVGLFGDFAGVTELLDDPVISVPLDNLLDVRSGVPRCDDEVIGNAADPLILLASKDAFGAGRVRALTEKLDRLWRPLAANAPPPRMSPTR
jgi:hypothetical protein